MPWVDLTGEDGKKVQVHVCGGRRRRTRCAWCSSWATRFCDGKRLRTPAGKRKKSGTCDAPMCANHGVEIGKQVLDGVEQGIDWCPDCCLEDLKSRPAPR